MWAAFDPPAVRVDADGFRERTSFVMRRSEGNVTNIVIIDMSPGNMDAALLINDDCGAAALARVMRDDYSSGKCTATVLRAGDTHVRTAFFGMSVAFNVVGVFEIMLVVARTA